jgi:hypothetical protein
MRAEVSLDADSTRQSSDGGDPDAALTVGWRCRRPQRRGRYRCDRRRRWSADLRRAAAAAPPPRSHRWRQTRAARARGADMPDTAGDASAPSSDTVRCARPTERHPPRVCLARLPACRASELQRGACSGWQTRMCAWRGDEFTELSQTPTLGRVGAGCSAPPGSRAEAGHRPSRSRGCEEPGSSAASTTADAAASSRCASRRTLARAPLAPAAPSTAGSGALAERSASAVVGDACQRRRLSSRRLSSASAALGEPAAPQQLGGRGCRSTYVTYAKRRERPRSECTVPPRFRLPKQEVAISRPTDGRGTDCVERVGAPVPPRRRGGGVRAPGATRHTGERNG